MKHSLFRQQALDFQHERPLGDVVRVHKVPFSFLTAFAVIIAFTLIAFACWGEYTRKSHVTGFLSPSKGLIKV